MSRIIKIVPGDGYTLEVFLENGSSFAVNFESKLHTVRFGMLADKEFFRRAATDGSYIRWDNKIEISINEVFQLAQNTKSLERTIK